MRDLKLKEVIGYFPILLITLSCFKLYIFFNYYYGIPISDYLGLGDIGFILIADLADLLFSAIGIFLLWQCVVILIRLNGKKYDINLSPNEKVLNVIDWISIILLVGMGAIFIIRYNTFEHINRMYFYCIMLYVLIFSLLYMAYRANRKHKKESTTLIYIGLFVTLILSQAILTVKSLDNNRSGKNHDTVVTIGDSAYSGKSGHYYIGKTEKYVFLYNYNDSTAKAVKMEDVKSIKYKNK